MFQHQCDQKISKIITEVPREESVEGFSFLVFILMNPRNFLVIQESWMICASSVLFDMALYNKFNSSRSGSTKGCGLESMEAILTRRGVKNSLMWGFTAFLTLSPMSFSKRTLSGTRRWALTSSARSHPRWSPAVGKPLPSASPASII